MKITVFGATDILGKYIVREAIALNNEVYAFGRNIFTSGLQRLENIHLLQGTLFDEDQVYNALKDSDAVIVVINPPTDEFDKSRSLGIKNILKQMHKAVKSRLIYVGSTAILSDSSGKMLMENPDFPKESFDQAREDLTVMQLLKESKLQWTYIALPSVKDEEVTGLYKSSTEYIETQNSLDVKAGDAGLFILNELNKNENVNTVVMVYN